MAPRIVLIGEAMLELSAPAGEPGFGDRFRLGFGGDSLNTAIYLARFGLSPAYLTALGVDGWSDALVAAWAAEGVATQHVLRHPRRTPGLYAIETDPDGERRFSYWRETSAARALFDCDGAEDALRAAAKADWLYLSGITLSIFDEAGRDRLTRLAEAVRERGGEVAFDPNFRPRGWSGPAEARAAIQRIAPFVSIALPTHPDEDALFGEANALEHARRWREAGAREVVIKQGEDGALVFDHGGVAHRAPAAPHGAPVDTTGAGDSFNAGYLAGRIRGLDPMTAASLGNRLAGAVVMHRGAIVPRGVSDLFGTLP